MRKLLLSVALIISIGVSTANDLNIIPQPNHVKIEKGEYILKQGATLIFSGVEYSSKRLLTDYLIGAGYTLGSTSTSPNKIVLIVDKSISNIGSDEGYRLEVKPNEITVSARTQSGLFYGIQSLVQLPGDSNKIPAISISDYPRFPYRGVHIDVGRHFFSVDFLKKQIDVMAHLKINRFHWHLTDGPGWRLEIKKYPLLTQKAAWRTHETWKEWWATNPREYVDIRSGKKAYGGFYTQNEAREIVRYAAARHITVIPEIEMPGHSEEVLAVYPELSCLGEPYKQSEFCIGNEKTFKFLENVLKEVITIFPSEYIHIGGDEADKSHWKNCSKCQARMNAEGLKDVDELQSYLIRRIEKFLIKNNRKLLGWDEILEGGLAPEATVMSWRGEDGGIKAAKSGHDAIMTPGSHMYLDSYQTTPGTQPEAIGGYLPLEKVYSYDPIPQVLSEKEAKHILGVQSNLWTEYIPTEKYAEYMLYPRVLALSEVAWTNPDSKSWEDFKRRVNQEIPRMKKKGINTYTLSDEVIFKHRVDSQNKAIVVTLETEKYGQDIRYTTNGETPNNTSEIYTKPLLISDSAKISAQLFYNKRATGKITENRFDYHHAIGKTLIYNNPINKYYPAAGEKSLIDGEKGGLSHGDGRWQGFMNKGLDVTIDLGENTSIKLISARFIQSAGAWIYFPGEVTISISDDNQNFTTLTTLNAPVDENAAGTLFHDFGWKGSTNGRYIRYQATTNVKKGSWVFLDEIVVW